jgi:hypothetical protein
MAVSGTNTFTLTKNEVIEMAFARLGIISDGATLTSYQLNRGSQLLNVMIKSWLAKGFRLWKQERATLFLEASTNEYILGTANATTSYVNPTLSADATNGATSISVSSVTGLVIGYNIGVVQSNNTILWTTITNIVSTTITLNNALTSDASSGNNVFVYQTKLDRIENIINAQLKMNSTTEIPLQVNSRDTYDALPVKTLIGIPNKIYFNKQLNQNIIRLFPQPSSVNYFVNFTYQKQFYDMTNPTDNFDFPAEWLRALYLNLAVSLYGFYPIVEANQSQFLIAEAKEALMEVISFDDENTSIYFEPATDQNRGNYA